MRTTRLIIPVFLGILITTITLGSATSIRNVLADTTADVIFVDVDNTSGTYNGLSWPTAYTNVQTALAVVGSNGEIWVAEGVYYPDEGVGQINGSVTSTFVLTDGVSVYGGFDPSTLVIEFQARDWDTYVTVLSGDLGGDDITTSVGVVTSTENISGINAYHVVTLSSVDTGVILEGFTITAGSATGDTEYNQGGGGLNSYRSAPYLLKNLVFSGNLAEWGGGMYCVGYGHDLNSITFIHNTAQAGGGLYISSHDPELSGVKFIENTASMMGGGLITVQSDAILNNLSFHGNSVTGDGYGGGGMAVVDGEPILTNVVFSGNFSNGYGGAMYNGAGYGESNPSLTNVTISGNTAALYGSGIFNFNANPILTNVIIWGNSGYNLPLYNIYESIPSINHSLLENSSGSGPTWNLILGVDAGFNIDVDPLFIREPDPGDGDWTTLEDNDYGDLRLQIGSPAIDAGTNTNCPAFDLDGRSRPLGVSCDMGAYESGMYINLPLVLR